MGTGPNTRVLTAVELVKFPVGGLDHDLTAQWHRISGVDHQVDQNLLDLARIRLDPLQGRIQYRDNFDVRGNQTMTKIIRAPLSLIYITRLSSKHLLCLH